MNSVKLIFVDEKPFLVDQTATKMNPLGIDFAEYDREMRLGASGRRCLLQAVGVSSHQRLQVLDATAGLARDAFFMAKFGCDVSMIEQAPELVTLLEYALKHNDSSVKNLQLYPGNALEVIPRLPAFEVIYLDPMFHIASPKAKVKKDLQLLQALHVGVADEAEALFLLALQHAVKRVVVKRDRRLPFLAGHKPHWSIKTQSVRFDVYCLNLA